MTASKTARAAELRAAAAEASTPAELAQLCASCCSLCAECCQDYIDDPSEANETLCRAMSGLCSEICQRCSDAMGGAADALADRVDFALAGEKLRERMAKMATIISNGPMLDLSKCPEQHRERVRQVLAEMHHRRYIRNGMAEAERAAATARDKAAARSRNVEPAPTPEPGPAKLADLIGVMPEAPLSHLGRAYEALEPRQKHQLMLDDRVKFGHMRDDWCARGKPDAGPRDLIGSILHLARACGLDLSDRPAAPQLEVVR